MVSPSSISSLMGSSPLTRGKPPRLTVGSTLTGLIPAHAGKTPWRGPARLRWWAHPRSRGENHLRGPLPEQRNGSSPLTRGKPSCGATRALGCGLIPAHAGKTIARLRRAWSPGAHPRSRGENVRSLGDISGKAGSSPLTRGKRRHRGRNPRRPGLIPAHAGKTQLFRGRGGLGPAHPRSRGENLPVLSALETMMGSSPLTRGKQQTATQVHGHVGLIPAHAGKTDRVLP